MYVWMRFMADGHWTGEAKGLCTSRSQALEYMGVTQADYDEASGFYRKGDQLWWLVYVQH
jgi:hypothetical protein